MIWNQLLWDFKVLQIKDYIITIEKKNYDLNGMIQKNQTPSQNIYLGLYHVYIRHQNR